MVHAPSPLQKELSGHLVAAAAITTFVVIALVINTSVGQITDGLRYLFLDRRPWTLLALVMTFFLVGAGVFLIRRSIRMHALGNRTRSIWIGRALVWGPILIPLVTGFIWWAFFSAGEFG